MYKIRLICGNVRHPFDILFQDLTLKHTIIRYNQDTGAMEEIGAYEAKIGDHVGFYSVGTDLSYVVLAVITEQRDQDCAAFAWGSRGNACVTCSDSRKCFFNARNQEKAIKMLYNYCDETQRILSKAW